MTAGKVIFSILKGLSAALSLASFSNRYYNAGQSAKDRQCIPRDDKNYYSARYCYK